LLSIERSDSSTTGTDGNKAVDYSNDNQINTVTTSMGSNEAYQFDTLGNRSTWSTDPLDSRRLLNDGTYQYLYDDEGNLSDKTELATGKITSYQWDYRNRLVSVTSDSHTIEYLYDAQDKRVSKQLDGIVRERYIYDGEDIALVVNAQGTLVERYLYGDSTDSVLAVERDGTISWSLGDRQGSVVDLVDEDGTVLNHFVYDSFGNRTATTGVEFRYGYTGRELDAETGLYYYRARYYDASVGRFISEDPMGFGAGDTNLYRYVFNNATNYTDPSGQIVPLIALAWAAGVVAGAAVTGAAVGATFGFARGAAESIDSDRRNGILSWESVGSAYIHGLIGAGKGAVVGAVGGAVVAGGGLVAGAIGVPTAVITGVGATLATVGVGAGVLSAGVNFANGNYATGLVDLAGALYGGSKLWSAYQNSQLRLYEEPNTPLLNSSGDGGGQIVPTIRSLAPATTPPGWSRGFDGALVASPGLMLPGQTHQILPPAIEFNPNLYNHLTTVEGINQQKGASGGHNRDNFLQYASNTRTNIRGSNQKLSNIRIDNEVPTSVQGLSEIKYSILAGDPRKMGGFIGQYKSIKDPKTVYDSSIISDSQMFNLCQDAARKVFVDAIRNQKAVVLSESGGINFLVYLDLKNNRIRNVHPVTYIKK
jgi:RHS repeat-associated protein